jgi:hypothetical protein
VPIKYDPDHFPPTEAIHVGFCESTDDIITKYNEASKPEEYGEDIERIGHDVGVSLMSHVSNFKTTFNIALGMADSQETLDENTSMKDFFMQNVLLGARKQALAKVEHDALNAFNTLAVS